MRTTIGHSVSPWQGIPSAAPASKVELYHISSELRKIPPVAGMPKEPDDQGEDGPCPLPRRCRLSHIVFQVQPEEGSGDITWWITADAAGAIPITEQRTSTYIPGFTLDGTEYGGVAEKLDIVYKAMPSAQGLYVWAYSADSADAPGRAMVFWEVECGCGCGS